MCACSAFDVDFCAAESSFRSAVLVSKSRHAKVYRCCFAQPGSSDEQSCCVKTIQADGPFLQHQLSLFSRISEAFCGREADAGTIERGTPPLLQFGVIPALDREKYEATLYVVTPWVEGRTLNRLVAEAVQERRSIAISEALALLRAVAAGLRDFSRCEAGACLVHQDIKPSNILIATDPRLHAVVIDLDTAFFLDEIPQEIPYGSCGYTAPEGISRRGVWPNEAMDVFSFGVIAHEVLTGCWPYPFQPRFGDDLRFWVSHYRRKDALCVSEGLPSDIRSLLESCVSLDPQERPSYESLVERLDLLVDRYVEMHGLFCVFEPGIGSSRMLENLAISDTF